jgi:hypothetical protein
MAQVVHTNRRHSNCIRITAAGRGHGTGPAYANQARGCAIRAGVRSGNCRAVAAGRQTGSLADTAEPSKRPLAGRRARLQAVAAPRL